MAKVYTVKRLSNGPHKKRITRSLAQFFKAQNLTASEHTFIQGCIKMQQRYPQLTAKQWDIVQTMYRKYKEKQCQ